MQGDYETVSKILYIFSQRIDLKDCPHVHIVPAYEVLRLLDLLCCKVFKVVSEVAQESPHIVEYCSRFIIRV